MLVPNDLFFSLVEESLSAENSVVIVVRGQSMRPFLEEDRDKVKLVRPTRALKVGDAVLARLANGHCVMHRIVRKDGTRLTLQGDGLRNCRETCDESAVLAIVSEYIRPHGTLKAESLGMKVAVRLWMGAAPIRRYLLYVYRKRLASQTATQ